MRILEKNYWKLIQKRKTHSIYSDEIEIGPLQLRLMLGDDWDEELALFTESFFCDCGTQPRTLTNFKCYLNELNDITLKGWCSECNTIAARYIETGEREGIDNIADKIRKLNQGGL